MADLLNPTQIARAVNITDKAVSNIIETLKIKPTYSAKIARGVMRLYDVSTIETIKEHLEQEKRKAENPPPVEDDQVGSLAVAVSEMYDKLELVSQQHASLLRAVERTREELMGAITLVANHVRGVEDMVKVLNAAPPPVAAPAPAPMAAVNNVVEIKQAANSEPPKDTRKHVAVLALPNSHRDAIKKEFKDVFQLEFFESDEVNGRNFEVKLNRFDAVLGMTGFLNHGISKLTHFAGSKFIPVRGGVSSLRDKLTELFIKVA